MSLRTVSYECCIHLGFMKSLKIISCSISSFCIEHERVIFVARSLILAYQQNEFYIRLKCYFELVVPLWTSSASSKEIPITPAPQWWLLISRVSSQSALVLHNPAKRDWQQHMAEQLPSTPAVSFHENGTAHNRLIHLREHVRSFYRYRTSRHFLLSVHTLYKIGYTDILRTQTFCLFCTNRIKTQ